MSMLLHYMTSYGMWHTSPQETSQKHSQHTSDIASLSLTVLPPQTDLLTYSMLTQELVSGGTEISIRRTSLVELSRRRRRVLFLATMLRTRSATIVLAMRWAERDPDELRSWDVSTTMSSLGPATIHHSYNIHWQAKTMSRSFSAHIALTIEFMPEGRATIHQSYNTLTNTNNVPELLSTHSTDDWIYARVSSLGRATTHQSYDTLTSTNNVSTSPKKKVTLMMKKIIQDWQWW